MHARTLIRAPPFVAYLDSPPSFGAKLAMTMHGDRSGRDFNDAGCADLRHAVGRINRRQMLQAGSLGLLGLGLPQLLAVAGRGFNHGALAGTGFGKAKRCILLFMWGGPSQLDTFDMKPDAPAKCAGRSSRSRPACPTCRSASTSRGWPSVTDKLAIIRSLQPHRSGPSVERPCHADRPLGSQDQQRRRAAQRTRHAAHLGSMLARLRGGPGHACRRSSRCPGKA